MIGFGSCERRKPQMSERNCSQLSFSTLFPAQVTQRFSEVVVEVEFGRRAFLERAQEGV